MIRDAKMDHMLEAYIQGGLTNGQRHEFEKLIQEDPRIKSDLILTRELEDAFTEHDIHKLRATLQEMSVSSVPQQEKVPAWFDLADDADFSDLPEQVFSDSVSAESFETLPRIHLNNHHMQTREVLHQIYLQEMKTLESAESDDPDSELADIESALTEKDVMNLRESLLQIGKSHSSNAYPLSDMEAYLDGELTPEQLKEFEEEMEFNPSLAAEIELIAGMEQAIGERDVMELRETLVSIASRETSTPFALEDLEAFICEDVSAEMRYHVESELSENTDLHAEINLIRELDEAFTEQDVLSLREKLGILAKDMKVTEEKSIVPSHTRNKGLRTFAAVMLAVLGLSVAVRYIALPDRSMESLAGETPTAITPFRSAVPDINSRLETGFEQYNSGDFNGALTSFQTVLELEGDNPVARFYSGASNQSLQDYENAIGDYSQVIQHNDNIFVEQAEWYMGLCLVQLQDYETASGVFEAIINRKGFYERKASVLLKKLK
jgi:tetratricopeptide (TPR) repeat protein